MKYIFCFACEKNENDPSLSDLLRNSLVIIQMSLSVFVERIV